MLRYDISGKCVVLLADISVWGRSGGRSPSLLIPDRPPAVPTQAQLRKSGMDSEGVN
jgi:hypothetical protein